MKKTSILFLILCCGFFKAAFASDNKIVDSEIEKGRNVFVKNCSMCHGLKGDGKGPAAASITKPKPCNFISDELKYGNNLEQIIKTISQGVSGTAMPSWKELSEDDKKAVAKYILKIRSKNHPTK